MNTTPPENAAFTPIPNGEAPEPGASTSVPLDDSSENLPEQIEGILERLPPEDRGEAANVLMRLVAQYSGPVPPSGEMMRYKAIDASFPERFVAMAERQSAHRQSLETKVVEGDITLKRRGQDYALLSVIIGLATALVFSLLGAHAVAGIVAGTTVIGVAGAFITGRVLESRSESAAEPAGKPGSE